MLRGDLALRLSQVGPKSLKIVLACKDTSWQNSAAHGFHSVSVGRSMLSPLCLPRPRVATLKLAFCSLAFRTFSFGFHGVHGA